jgi:hypothetical protein
MLLMEVVFASLNFKGPSAILVVTEEDGEKIATKTADVTVLLVSKKRELAIVLRAKLGRHVVKIVPLVHLD